MAKKLTEQEIKDRIDMYDEAVAHMQYGSIYENDGEKVQGQIIAAQIKASAKRFYKKNRHRINQK